MKGDEISRNGALLLTPTQYGVDDGFCILLGDLGEGGEDGEAGQEGPVEPDGVRRGVRRLVSPVEIGLVRRYPCMSGRHDIASAALSPAFGLAQRRITSYVTLECSLPSIGRQILLKDMPLPANPPSFSE